MGIFGQEDPLLRENSSVEEQRGTTVKNSLPFF